MSRWLYTDCSPAADSASALRTLEEMLEAKQTDGRDACARLYAPHVVASANRGKGGTGESDRVHAPEYCGAMSYVASQPVIYPRGK